MSPFLLEVAPSWKPSVFYHFLALTVLYAYFNVIHWLLTKSSSTITIKLSMILWGSRACFLNKASRKAFHAFESVDKIRKCDHSSES